MILLSQPNIAGNEWKYVKECLDTGWLSSIGAYVSQFEQSVADFAGARYGVATMNGTASLHIAQLLMGITSGDYVLLPNITFVASANSVRYCGAEPLLIDVDPDTWQMDLDLLEDFLREHTYIRKDETFMRKDNRRIPAIMPVHVLGNMCDMERLQSIATQYHLQIIEDSTEALGSRFKGQHAGTFGVFGTFSFNGNKIISTGGGGIIVTNQEALAKKARHLTTQAKADSFEYIHDEIGYNYRLVNILAAVGVGQMEHIPDFLVRKKELASRYRESLEDRYDYRFQVIGNDVEPNHWLNTFQTRHQKKLMEHLLAHEIQCRPLWLPMNQLVMFKDCIYIQRNNVSDYIYQTCLSIPSSTNLSEEDLNYVINTILSFNA